MGDPVHGRRADIAFAVIGREHIDPVRDHAQSDLLGLGVHRAP